MFLLLQNILTTLTIRYILVSIIAYDSRQHFIFYLTVVSLFICLEEKIENNLPFSGSSVSWRCRQVAHFSISFTASGQTEFMYLIDTFQTTMKSSSLHKDGGVTHFSQRICLSGEHREMSKTT